MNSKIPTFSAKKPTISRIPSLSSAVKPSNVHSGLRKNISEQSLTLTGMKRPLNETSIPSSTKFKRTTPLSLMKTTNDSHNVKEFNPPTAMKLDFGDSFRTPMIQKNVPSFQTASRIPTCQKTIIPDKINETKQENLSVKPKIFESKATSPIVDWQTITNKSEILSYTVRNNKLQQENANLQCEIAKMSIDNKLKETKLRNEIDEGKNKIKELLNEIESLKKNEENLKYDLEEFQKINLKQSNLLEKQKIESDLEISQLKDGLLNVKTEAERYRSQISLDSLNYQHQINLLQSEIDRLKEENQIHQSNSNDYELKKQEVVNLKNELNKANETITDLKNELKSHDEGKKLESLLQGELGDLESIKEENVHLKNKLDLLSQVRDENIILREKILGLENNVHLLSQQLNQKNVDLYDLESSKEKLNEWIQLIGMDSPDLVAQKINQLNENVSMLTVENDMLKSEIKILKEKSGNDEYQAKLDQFNLKKANEEVVNLTELLEQANKKCSFLTKERDFYKNMTSSIEKNVNNNEENNQRITELESIVEEYKTIVSQLEADLQKAREELEKMNLKDKEIEELKTEIARIKDLNPHICTNISSSMLDVSTLQTNEKQFRIMHLNDNPLSIEIKKRAEDLENLKEENQKLKFLIETLEHGHANNPDITRQIDEGIQYRLENKKLKNLLDKAERNYKDLQQIFKKNCDSFRLACMELTGYQIDFISKNIYRLRHKYSFKNEFRVEIDEDKTMKLFEDSITDQLQNEIDYFLKKYDSFPAFFASYSLDVFKKRFLDEKTNNSLQISIS